MSERQVDRDLVITGARIYTANPQRPWCEAIVVRGERVLYCGNEGEALRQAGPHAERLHIPGALVTPGLNDSHIHLLWGGATIGLLNFEGAETVQEVQSRLRAHASSHADDAWIHGYGLGYEWSQGLGGHEKEALDEAEGARPVFIYAMDRHSAWVNSNALGRAGIMRGSSVPPPNEVVVDAVTGLATGMLKERLAIELVTHLFGAPSSAEEDEQLLRAARYVHSLGITSVQNMNGAAEDLARYERLSQSGQLSLRASHYVNVREGTRRDEVEEFARLRGCYTGNQNSLRGIKLFIDGVVESKTALVLAPYADGSGLTGFPDMDLEAYSAFVRQGAQLGMDVATHAIGDRGVRLALDAYEAALRDAPGGRHRVEHIELIDPLDMARFSALGVTASMQPLHAVPTGDPRSTPWTVLVGHAREPQAFAWRSIRASGARLVFGSDWPIVTPDVRQGLFAALARKSAGGVPVGGWQPQQTLTLAEALDAYTREAAFIERQEHEKGMLREGMLADVTAFAVDLFTLTPDELRDVPVALTIVGGKIVHRQDI